MPASAVSLKAYPENLRQDNIMKPPIGIDVGDRISRLRSENDTSQSIINTEQLKIKTNNEIISKLQSIDTQKNALSKSQGELSTLTEKARSIKNPPTDEEKQMKVQTEIAGERAFQKMSVIAILLIIILTFALAGLGFIMIQIS